jgi:hypothetical protein
MPSTTAPRQTSDFTSAAKAVFNHCAFLLSVVESGETLDSTTVGEIRNDLQTAREIASTVAS